MVATKKEWLQSLREEPHKHDRMVFVPRLIVGLIFLAGIALWAGKVFAQPIAVAAASGVTITVYSDDCQLKETVTNLPKRATWQEGQNTYEGCVGVYPDFGVAAFYFKDDKTVAVVPLQMFTKATGV